MSNYDLELKKYFYNKLSEVGEILSKSELDSLFQEELVCLKVNGVIVERMLTYSNMYAYLHNSIATTILLNHNALLPNKTHVYVFETCEGFNDIVIVTVAEC